MDKQALAECIADQERLLFDTEIPEEYLSDALGRRKGTADALVFPLNTQEISSVLQYAHKNRIPVTPRGRGPISWVLPSPSRAASSWICPV